MAVSLRVIYLLAPGAAREDPETAGTPIFKLQIVSAGFELRSRNSQGDALPAVGTFIPLALPFCSNLI